MLKKSLSISLFLLLILLFVLILRNSSIVLNSIKSNVTYSFNTQLSVYNLTQVFNNIKSKGDILASTATDNFSNEYINNGPALENYLDKRKPLMKNILINTEWAQGIWLQLDSSIAFNDHYYYNWYYFDKENIKDYPREHGLLDPEATAYYYDAKKLKTPIWTPVYIDPDIKMPMITYSIPMYKNRKFIGCAGMDVSLAEIGSILQSIHKEYKDSELYLLSKDRNILASYPFDNKILNKNFFEHKNNLMKLDNEFKTPDKNVGNLDYKENLISKVAVFSRLSNDNYYLVITMPTSTLYDKFNALINLTYFMFAILSFSLLYTLHGKYRMEKLKDTAEAASKVRSEFLANMSHEIRTPMNGVIGYIQLLQDTQLTKEQKGFLDEMQKSSGLLLSLLNDVLDFSKLESGKVTIENISFDLPALLEDVVNLSAINAYKKEIEINVLIHSDIPQRVFGDPSRLRQVFNNLVSNAVKFTVEGEVLLSAKKVSEDDETVEIFFEVKDTGIGISENAQKTLFDAFMQADSSTTRKYGGTGLGLAIVKNTLDLMNSEIFLDSQPGKGSIFFFSIKFRKDLTTNASRSKRLRDTFKQHALKDLNILVVDDTLTNLTIMKYYLESLGCRIQQTSSVDKAITILENRDNKFDVILTDHCMPMKSGYDLVEFIKSQRRLKDIPVILNTSADKKGDDAFIKEKGFAGYMTKPITKINLINSIYYALNPDREEVLVTQHVIQENEYNNKYKILIVEDFIENQILLATILKKAGFVFDIAKNGAEAVDAFRNKHYDLILMDCQMPVMDGYEATQKIREIENGYTHIPIIALTAHAMGEAMFKCINAGMDDYLTKPFEIDKMINMMNSHLNTPVSASNTDEHISGELTGNKAEEINYDNIIAGIMENLHFTKEEALELYNGYMEILPEQITIIKNACETQDFEVIRRTAHTLKGSSVRIEKLRELFLNLEKAGESCNIESCKSVLHEIEELVLTINYG